MPLLAVADYGLPGASRSFPSQPLDEAAWSLALDAAAGHRVVGLLNKAITEGALPVTDAQRQQAFAAHRRTRLLVLGLEQQLAGVVDVLERGGVATRILKGSAVARLDYAEPAVRSSSTSTCWSAERMSNGRWRCWPMRGSGALSPSRGRASTAASTRA